MDISQFISAIENHTKALILHTEALAKHAGEAVEGAIEGAVKRGRGRPAKGEATAETAATATAQGTSTAAQTSAPASAPAQTTAQPAAPQATLKQVADAIVAVVEDPKIVGGRDKVVAIMAKYGATKVPELKAENFAAVLAEVNALKTPAAPQSAAAGLF